MKIKSKLIGIALSIIILAISLNYNTALAASQQMPGVSSFSYVPGDEVISKRTKLSKTIYKGIINNKETYETTFVSSPMFTKDTTTNQFIDYKFQNNSSYYQVQHPWVSVRFYDNYTEIWNEAFTSILVYTDMWQTEYANKQGAWVSASAYSPIRSYQIVSDGIKLIRTYQTNIGQRIEEYYFKNGSPLKITIKQTTTISQTLQFKWVLSGIVAQNIGNIIETNKVTRQTKVVGSKATDANGDRVGQILWNDALKAGVPNIVPTYESVANGKKVTITCGTFTTLANGVAILDPSETFYPDSDPETNSVDGIVVKGDWETEYSWTDLTSGDGDYASTDATYSLGIYAAASSTLNKWYENDRTILLFDTSLLSDSANISTAILTLTYADSNDTYDDNPAINIYGANPESNTELSGADYDTIGTTPYSTNIYVDDLIPINNFVFNSTGISAINKIGVSKFGIREAVYDVTGNSPSWNSDTGYYILLNSSEYGEGYRPKLVITYTEGGQIFIPKIIFW